MARFRSILETRRNAIEHDGGKHSDRVFLLIERIDDLAAQLDQREDDERAQLHGANPSTGHIKALHRLHSDWELNGLTF